MTEYLPLALQIITLLGVSFCMYRLHSGFSKQDTELRKIKQNIDSSRNDQYANKVGKAGAKYNTGEDHEKINMASQIKELENRNRELKITNDELLQEIQKLDTGPPVSNKKPGKEPLKEIHLEAPSSDKTFNSSAINQSPNEKTLYIIHLTGENSGDLSVNNNSSLILSAINSPEVYLDHAVEYENQPKGNHRNIKTLKPGKVNRNGKNWSVVEKAKVSFN